MPIVDEELLADFVAESRDDLRSAEAVLMDVESVRAGRGELGGDEIGSLFRSFHSMKGSAGFLGLTNIGRTAHAVESLLELVRDAGELPPEDVVFLLCDAIDVLVAGLDAVESAAADGAVAEASAAMVQRLADAAATFGKGTAGTAEVSQAPPAPEPEPEPEPQIAAPAPAPQAEAVAAPETPAPAPEPKAPEAAAPPATPEAQAAAPAKADGARTAHESIRVDVRKLDELMNLVGELTLAETMVVNNPDLADLSLERFQRSATHLNRITRNLQSVATAVRMVPIRSVFQRMQRVAVDVARKQGKQIDVEMRGEDTEVDKNLIEHIAAPMLHLVRNAVDHGIEAGERRVAAGKGPVGTLILDAKREGNEVWITVGDDGEGLDEAAILAKAVERGLVDPQDEPPDPASLIFEPGFSTAKVVTDVSGRGVGMDVVRRNIQDLKGSVEVVSRRGEGTAFLLRIPLTLAITEAMLVQIGRVTYAFPVESIQETVLFQPSMRTRVPGGVEIINLRGKSLRLARVEHLRCGGEETERAILLVVQSTRGQFGCLVDSLLGQRQLVIKALPTFLGAVNGVSGCSILSDGGITLVVDPERLDLEAQRAREGRVKDFAPAGAIATGANP